jgi:hypothetical protein
MTQTDSMKWWPRVTVQKWNPETVREITAFLGHEPNSMELMALTGAPDEITEGEGNALTTAGLQRVTSLITSNTPKPFSNTYGMAGVGDSSAAFAVGQTTLQGTSFYVGLNASMPVQPTVAGAISATADFSGTQANYIWNEWCWAIATTTPVANATFATATTGGVMLNRAIQNLGTKASGAVWTLSAQVTIT